MIAVLLYLPSLFVDYLRLGDGSAFATALFVKLSAFGFVSIAALLTKQPGSRYAIEFILFLGAISVSSGLIVSAILSQSSLGSHTLAGLLAILVYYLFIPNRLLWTISIGVGTTIGFLYVMETYYNSNIRDLISLTLVYLAANVLGYVNTVRVRTLHRNEFLNRNDLKYKLQELEEVNEYLQQSQSNIDQLFDAAPLPLILVGADNSKILKTNSAAQRFFLLSNPKSEDLKTTDFLPLEENRNELRQALDEKGEIRGAIIQARKADGTKVWGLVSVLPVKLGNFEARMVAFADITERQRAEEKLRSSEDELQTIVNNMPDVFYRTDAEDYIRIISPACSYVIGYTQDELIGTKMSNLYVDPDDRKRVQSELVAAKGKPTQVEAFMTHKSGKIIWVSTRAFLRLDDEGNILGVEGIARDLSDKKQMEDQLRSALKEASDADKAKSKFLAAASHDLRQPLQALMLYSGILTAKAKEQDEKKIISKIGNGLGTMSELLDALLDISKLDAGAIEPWNQVIPLQQIFERLSTRFQPLATEKNIDLKIISSSLNTYSDPVLLENVISNLITNAIRYTEKGKVLVGCRRKGAEIEIGIWDTGIGIAKDESKRIFEDFYQVGNEARDRRQGLGLGLSIVDRTLKLLGHTLDWGSEKEIGSHFIVTVPLTTAPVSSKSTIQSPTSSKSISGKVILLIEDEVDVLFALSSFLVETGYSTIEATSQEQALEKLKEEPDLILADYRLANGLTGGTAIEAIRSHFNKKISAIIITGDTEPDRINEIHKGNFTLIHKPVNHRKLLKIISEIMN